MTTYDIYWQYNPKKWAAIQNFGPLTFRPAKKIVYFEVLEFLLAFNRAVLVFTATSYFTQRLFRLYTNSYRYFQERFSTPTMFYLMSKMKFDFIIAGIKPKTLPKEKDRLRLLGLGLYYSHTKFEVIFQYHNRDKRILARPTLCHCIKTGTANRDHCRGSRLGSFHIPTDNRHIWTPMALEYQQPSGRQ